jgi:disulfide bond formation protein DsbB
MAKFMFKCFGIILLLLFGVLFGIQKAHIEMNEMKGTSGPGIVESLSRSLAVEEHAKPSSHDLKAKQETLNRIDSFNAFSALGQKVTDWISVAFTAIVYVLGVVIKEMIGVFLS